jgi:hypothetical protein
LLIVFALAWTIAARGDPGLEQKRTGMIPGVRSGVGSGLPSRPEKDR